MLHAFQPRALARVALALLLTLVLALPAPALAQATTTEEGAEVGRDVTEQVAPGLEQQTPSAQPIRKEDVPLYIPHEDQIIGRVSIPDVKLATLVQPEGRTWRAFRMSGLFWTATIVIVLTLLGLAAFYLIRGTIRLERGRSGRWIPRFNWLERFAHWTAAVSFLALALTGLVITFGRFLLIPVVGHEAFTALANGSKYVHNFFGVPFVIGVLLMLVLWIRDNLPTRADLEWVRQGGGMFKRHGSFHPETARFNAGQKGIFWIVVLGGILMAVSGYLLLTPFSFTGVSGMQVMHVIHALLAVLMIAVILGHIFIGTLGMEGSFDAMGRGEVDENWAIEHHRGWYEAQRRSAGAASRRAGPSGAIGAGARAR